MPKITSALAKILRQQGIDPEQLLEAYRDPVKAYKLFRQKDDELFPLFVNADKPVPMGEWLQAEAGALTDKGQVKSKIGPLAYRPGWHAGEFPLATHIGGKATEHGQIPKKPNYRPDNQVWAEIEMPNLVDWQQVANERARITKKGTPDLKTAHITDQVPYGGHYRYKTNPNMTGDWLISGDMRVNRLLDDAEVREINRGAGAEDLPRLRNLQRRKDYVPALAGGALGLGALADTEEAEAGIPDRLARAAEQGFDTTRRLFHGTANDFDEFDTGRAGLIYAAEEDPSYASMFAGPRTGANVMPLYMNPGKQLDMVDNPEHRQHVIDLFNKRGGWAGRAEQEGFGPGQEQEFWDAVLGEDAPRRNSYLYDPEHDMDWEILDDPDTGLLYDLQEQGYNSFRFKEDDGVIAQATDDPTRVRSVNAQFRDPESPNLLAGGAAAAVGLGALGSSEESEAMPLYRAFRGEHGAVAGLGEKMQSRLGALSFGDAETANQYAMSPNVSSDVAVQPRVYPSNVRIDNPVINNPEDPFLPFADLEKAVGFDQAKKVFVDLEGVNDSEYLDEILEQYDADSIADLPDEALRQLDVPAFEVFNDPETVQLMKNNGYDGGITSGYGENYDQVEFRPFDESQVSPAFGAHPPSAMGMDDAWREPPTIIPDDGKYVPAAAGIAAAGAAGPVTADPGALSEDGPVGEASWMAKLAQASPVLTGLAGAANAFPWGRGLEQLDMPQQGLFGLKELLQGRGLDRAAAAAQGDPWEMAGVLGDEIQGDKASGMWGLLSQAAKWGTRFGGP